MDELFISYFHKYYDDVYRLVYSYTLNKEDTEDICQRTFIKLYNYLKKDKISNTYVKKWLLRVAINDSKNLLTCFSRRNVSSIELSEFNLSSKNNQSDLLSNIKLLPKKYRFSLFLYYYEGYNIKEIADLLNTNESTIKTRLKRGRDLLKKEMEKCL